LVEGGMGAGRCDGSHCVECVTDTDCAERDGESCTTPVCQEQQCSEEPTASCNLSWAQSCTPATANFVPSDVVSEVSTNVQGAWLGSAIATSGDRLVVGAPSDGVANTADGAAFVYRFNAGTWTEEQKLVAPDPLPESGWYWPGSEFGSAVAVDGTTIAVGAWGRDDRAAGVTDAGAAYVFDYVSGAWQVSAELFSPEPVNRGQFGKAVALSGDWLAVSAFDSDADAVPVWLPGALYLYHRQNGQWTFSQKLQPAPVSYWGGFGSAIALSGDTLLADGDVLVGDSLRPTVHAFHYDGNTWAETQTFRPSDSQADSPPVDNVGGDLGDGFGYTIALDGNSALLAAWGHNGERPDQGAAYFYRYSNGLWQQVQELHSPDLMWDAGFGSYVALKGSLAVVTATMGAYGLPFNPQSAPGKAYVYQYESTHDTWLLSRSVAASDAGGASDDFGGTAAIAQGTIRERRERKWLRFQRRGRQLHAEHALRQWCRGLHDGYRLPARADVWVWGREQLRIHGHGRRVLGRVELCDLASGSCELRHGQAMRQLLHSELHGARPTRRVRRHLHSMQSECGQRPRRLVGLRGAARR
jgi:hypothetical protein